MKTLIISTYYNNPHHISHQAYLLKMFVDGEYDFVVLNDAGLTTRSLLSDNPSCFEIKNECGKQNIESIFVPQYIHTNIYQGGLVPDGLPANHPTERHRATLNWLFQSGFLRTKYNHAIIMESDMFLKQKLNIKDFVDGFDIMGTWRNGLLQKMPGQSWNPKCGDATEIDAKWLTFQFLCINLQTITNISDLDAGGFAGSDSGGNTHFFLKENPQYKVKFIAKWNDIDYQVDFISQEPTTCEDAQFLHLRAGTNWDNNSKEYYYEKMYRAFEKFIPSYKTELLNQNIQSKLYSSDHEHCYAPR